MSPRRRGSGTLSRAAARPEQYRRENRVFYVVAEGEGTEYDYLNHIDRVYGPECGFVIRTPAASVKRNGLEPSQVITEADAITRDDIYEVWGLFDHDGRSGIDQVYARAKRQDIKVAFSHPAFELWLLLHFQDFSPASQGGSNTEIMKKLRGAHPAFADYRDGSKRIDFKRFEALNENDQLRKAVARAGRLSDSFTTETLSNKDPSTDVHLLVESLGIVPGSSL